MTVGKQIYLIVLVFTIMNSATYDLADMVLAYMGVLFQSRDISLNLCLQTAATAAMWLDTHICELKLILVDFAKIQVNLATPRLSMLHSQVHSFLDLCISLGDVELALTH